MRERIGVFLAAFLYYSGLIKLSRWRSQHTGPRLVILNYHEASGGNLRRHLHYLSRHYRMLHLQDALEELHGSSGKRQQRGDPRLPLVLTFDDGYRDNYTHAFPLACEFQVPITIFLVPGYIESGSHFWWLEGERLVRRSQATKLTIEGYSYHLDRSEDRSKLAGTIDDHLHYAKSVADREAFLATIASEMLVSSSLNAEEEARLPLTWAQVHEMEKSGWVSFGAHTMHHPILANLSDPREVFKEVGECRELLERQLGHPVRTFAYPVGRAEHIGEKAIKAVREAGYSWAVTTVGGVCTLRDDPYLLHRVLGEVSRHWMVMAAETSGIWHLFARLWKNPLVSKLVKE